MRPTRRYWGLVGTTIVLAAAAVVFDQPMLLAGTAGLAAWLLATQVSFLLNITEAIEALDIDQSTATAHTVVEESVPVTLSANLPSPPPIALSIEASPPAAATGSTRGERTIQLKPDEDITSETVFTVSWPVAGAFSFDEPETEIDSALFTEQLAKGPTPTIEVDPRKPRNVHVGQGGDRMAAAFGQHKGEGSGAGLDPAELRQYVAGDSAADIDWKATARLHEPHVREYEVETDRQTALLVDHRSRLDVGREGETPLDYLRQVALLLADSASDLGDPIGLYGVGNEGLTIELAPKTTPAQYQTIRTELQNLTPTRGGDRSTGMGESDLAAARRAATALATDDSAFGSRLRPFLADADPYVARMQKDPLFETARTYLQRLEGGIWTVVFTDDTDRAGVRETVKLLRGGDGQVLVFLAPAALYEPGGLTDLDRTYGQYADFEEFRRRLARMDRVAAFEVAPGDRLDAVLSARRQQRQPAAGGP